MKRVAKNELTVGITFIAGPVLASLLASANGDFSGSYMKLAGFLLIGVIIQWTLAVMQSRRKT